ncbi:MAG: hypothetical protein OXD01_06230 [Gammaproteobacteria bacterium]|nr:hypothetical protein [Gammaproteobacteria bacterium]
MSRWYWRFRFEVDQAVHVDLIDYLREEECLLSATLLLGGLI